MTNFNDPNNIDIRQRSSNIRTLSTKNEYLNLITPLSKVEFDLLKQSIEKEGLHIPIVINKQGIVLDGHHRFKACKELGIPLKYQTKEFKDSLEEKQFVIEVNLRRRQLNEFQSANGLHPRRYAKRDGEEKDVSWWSYSRTSQQKRVC